MLEGTGVQTASSPAPSGGEFVSPEKAMRAFGLRPGMAVADFGSGSGHFALGAARIVGSSGKVYAIDIQKDALASIKSRANLERMLQVDTVWSDLELSEGSRLPASSVDFVIISNILFQTDKKEGIIHEAARITRPGGGLGLIEWDDTPFPAGPPASMRVSRDQIRTMAGQAGYRFEREFDAGARHYGLLFKK